MPLVRRTRATLRSAEFGFFGVCVNTRTHTPRFCGLFCSAGLFVLLTIFLRPARTSCEIVGIQLRKKYARDRRQLRDALVVSSLKARESLAPENPTDPRFELIATECRYS